MLREEHPRRGKSLLHRPACERVRSDTRGRIARAVSRRVGRGRPVPTDQLALSVGCTASLIVKTAGDAPDHPAAGETRMVLLMAALGAEFADEVLRPFGLRVTAAPEGQVVHPLSAAAALGKQGLTIIEHCEDDVLDLSEMAHQVDLIDPTIHQLECYRSMLCGKLEAGAPIHLTNWRAQ